MSDRATSGTETLTWAAFAVSTEAGPFKKRIASETSVRIVLTGMGLSRSRKTLEALLSREKPRFFISSGFAGGLNPALPGNTVLCDADADFPLPDPLELAGMRKGAFYCSPRVLTSVAEKKAAWERTRADAVEMESEGLRRLMKERGVPSATIRIISDAADEPLPLDFNQFSRPDQSLDMKRLAMHCLARPSRIQRLLRFQRELRESAQILADKLHAVVRELS